MQNDILICCCCRIIKKPESLFQACNRCPYYKCVSCVQDNITDFSESFMKIELNYLTLFFYEGNTPASVDQVLKKYDLEDSETLLNELLHKSARQTQKPNVRQEEMDMEPKFKIQTTLKEGNPKIVPCLEVNNKYRESPLFCNFLVTIPMTANEARNTLTDKNNILSEEYRDTINKTYGFPQGTVWEVRVRESKNPQPNLDVFSKDFKGFRFTIHCVPHNIHNFNLKDFLAERVSYVRAGIRMLKETLDKVRQYRNPLVPPFEVSDFPNRFSK